MRIAVGRVLHHLAHNVAHDLEVSVEQIVAAHARLAGNARGDDDDIGVSRRRVVVGAGHAHIALLRWASLPAGPDALPCGTPSTTSIKHHIGQFLGRDPVRRCGAHVAGADNADFLPHVFSLSFNF